MLASKALRARPFHLLVRRLRTQAHLYEYAPREEPDGHPVVRSALATPRQVSRICERRRQRLTIHITAREVPRRVCDRTGECEKGPLRCVRVLAYG